MSKVSFHLTSSRKIMLGALVSIASKATLYSTTIMKKEAAAGET